MVKAHGPAATIIGDDTNDNDSWCKSCFVSFCGRFPTWPTAVVWGYYPTSGLGLSRVVLVILLSRGRKYKSAGRLGLFDFASRCRGTPGTMASIPSLVPVRW